MHGTIKTNTLEFKIKSISYTTNINDTKKLLIDKKRQLSIGVFISKTKIYTPSDTSSYSKSDQQLHIKVLS